MRGDFGGHPDIALFGPSDQVHCFSCADVRQMYPSTGQLCQRDVPGCHLLFGDGRYSPNTETGRDPALVDVPSSREGELLAVFYYRTAEGGGIGKRLPY